MGIVTDAYDRARLSTENRRGRLRSCRRRPLISRRARLGLLAQPEVRWLQLAEETADEAKKRGILFNAVGASWVASRLAMALGDRERALSRANDAVALLGEMGAIEEDELEVLRAHADALDANGLNEAAEVARARADHRREEMAGAITDPELRRRFLAYVSQNSA